jgi:DUF2905 family protein
VNRMLIVLGAVLVVAGLLWPWLKKMHLFHLPGDIVIDRPGFKFFLPITTMLIVSAVLSIVAWLIRRYPGWALILRPIVGSARATLPGSSYGSLRRSTTRFGQSKGCGGLCCWWSSTTSTRRASHGAIAPYDAFQSSVGALCVEPFHGIHD